MAGNKRAIDVARRCAFLMGGNGLSTEQSILIMAHELANWQHGIDLTTKDGLVMDSRNGQPEDVGVIQADAAAQNRGHFCAEQFVQFLQKLEKRKIPAP